jgi:iron(III) transport system substrate-binding protein
MVVVSQEDGVSEDSQSRPREDEPNPASGYRIPDLAARGTAFWKLLPFLAIAALLVGKVVWQELILPLLPKSSATVIAYCSQDQVYAEPILKDFEKQTGIKVRAVFDSEAVKTVGLANRLLAERSHPQCDVFWNNEELRTRQLAAQNVFRETNAWAAVGYRSRRIVINTNKLALTAAPRSLLELTNEVWRGKVALAYPLFGTTATHFLALRQRWGDAGWQAWCRALAANKPFLVDGNSVAVKLVARGEALVGLTDSDDIAAEQREGSPVAALPLSDESLLIPNTIAVVRNAPHPQSAQRLFDYLQRPEVAERLVAANALEGISADQVKALTLKPDWPTLLRDLKEATTNLAQIFLR